jgi:hypothetical protein
MYIVCKLEIKFICHSFLIVIYLKFPLFHHRGIGKYMRMFAQTFLNEGNIYRMGLLGDEKDIT